MAPTQEDLDHIGRPGKGMGGTDDTGGAVGATDKDSPDEQDEDEGPRPPSDLDLPVNSGP